ncbi:GNAT family N-acetyltransferase [Aureibaculum conchae]|uniref:GNAT family N-acetyltransferase n=1 Tax=Aureibaculum sp. 2308TA14-22 TaxID=3108392 RepID=UPI00339339D3
MDLIIRKATIKDDVILALLGRVSFREAFGHFWTDEKVLRNYFKNTFSVEKIRSSITKENNVFWIAFADKLPVGYAKLKKYSPYESISDKRPAQLQKIYLLNDYVGNKIGKKMQDILFEEVQNLGIKTLWLAVWDKNDKAIKFYEKYGFEKTTKYHYEYENLKADYEVMTKTF